MINVVKTIKDYCYYKNKAKKCAYFLFAYINRVIITCINIFVSFKHWTNYIKKNMLSLVIKTFLYVVYINEYL